MRTHRFAVPFLTLAGCAMLAAQTPALKLDAVYECAGGLSFKVISCAGAGNADMCDVQSYAQGQPNQRGKSTHLQVMTLVPLCHLQTAAEAKGSAAAAARPQTGAGGFKIGDSVQIDTAFGWMDAKVMKVNGNSYFVHAQSGAEVWKPYPTELRRIGPINAEDRANGLYQLHDRVQVNVEGKWTDGEVTTEKGMEYMVTLVDRRTAWASGANLRLLAGADKPLPPPKGGVPPKPGMVSCAGKIEGRYGSSGGFGNFTVVFRAGKATVPDLSGDGGEELECWTSGTKILLHKPGNPNLDMSIDINNDGTLDTPLGEIRKKGN